MSISPVEAAISYVRENGGCLIPEGNRLRFDVPVGTLTPALKAFLRDNKDQVIKALEVEYEGASGACGRCGGAAWKEYGFNLLPDGLIVCGDCLNEDDFDSPVSPG